MIRHFCDVCGGELTSDNCCRFRIEQCMGLSGIEWRYIEMHETCWTSLQYEIEKRRNADET